MPIYIPPKRSTQLILEIGLISRATGQLQVNPTLAVGDVTISLDGGAFNNTTALPVVTPAGGVQVQVVLSAAEMTADNVFVVFKDVAGAEWDDYAFGLQTSAKQIDDLALEGTGGDTLETLSDQLDLVALTGGDADTLETLSDQIDGACTLGAGAVLSTGVWELDAQNLIAFVLVDAAGAVVPGLADTFDVFISKVGGAFNPSAGTKAEISNGWYSYLSTVDEADTPGPVAIYITGAGIVQQNLEYVVERRNVTAIEFTYTVTDSSTGLPIEGVQVWITTDLARNRVVWYGVTDAFGVARDDNGELPFLDPGTYYFWRQRAGFTFAPEPDIEVVS